MAVSELDLAKEGRATPERVFGLLDQWGLAPDPNSYEVAYLYLNGTSHPLVDGVHHELNVRGKLSAESLTDLRFRFLPEDKRRRRVEQIGKALNHEIGSLAGVVDQTLCLSYKTEIILESPIGIDAKIERERLKAVLTNSISKMADTRLELGSLGANLRRSQATLAELDRELGAIRVARLTDALTGLGNDRRIGTALTAAIGQAGKTKERVVLLLAELDHFDAFAKRHGRAISERVLCLVADALRVRVPKQAVLARCDSARFAVLLVDPSPGAELALADRLRRGISKSQIVSTSSGQSLGRLTLSVGTAGAAAAEDPRSVFEKAEIHLRQAQSAGGDRSVVR